MRKKWFHNKTKTIIQLVILAAIIGTVIVGGLKTNYDPDLEAYCPFGGLMSLGSKLNIGTMSCSMSENQVYIGIAFAVIIILFGKLFCGWLCPVGTVSEWFGKLGKRLGLAKDISGPVDRILRWLKYVLLFVTAYFTLTSSELFCKKFDPYFGVATGFGVDTVLLYGLLSLAAVTIISMFFKQFWCKYLCPLGALSNIISNIYLTLPILVVYILLRVAGVQIGIIWLLLALVLSAALTESIRYRFFSFSPFKIKVNRSACTNCNLCDTHCPQGIKVSEYDEVTHPDCTLCMDCVKACPQKDTNTVRGGTWWPPVVLVVAFFLALLIAQQNPMATLSERWGNYEQADSLGRVDKVVFDEMKTVKCFGSAYSLYSKMKRKPGIIGMDCWASKNKVTLYYNSTKLNETAVRKIVFTPTKYKIRTVGKGETAPERLLGYKMGVLGLWDGVDNIYMYRLLQKKDGIYGFKTEFGEPVLVTFYFDPEIVGLSHIDSLLDLRKYQYESKGEMVTQKINFKVEGREGYVDTLSYLEFSRRFFSGYDRGFNNYRDHIKDDIMIFEIDFPQVESSTVQRRLSYLTSHLSFDEGIVRMKTLITDKPVLRVYFLPEKTDANKIMMLLSAEKLKYMTRDGSEKETENIFEFEGDHRLFPR